MSDYTGPAILIALITAFGWGLWWLIFKMPPPEFSLWQCRLCKEHVYVKTGTAHHPFVCSGCAAAIRSLGKEGSGE